MSNNFTIPYALQLACRHPNTTIPGPPVLAHSTSAACAVSQFVPSAELILSTCCNTTTGNIVRENANGGYTPSNIFVQVPTAGYAANGCQWRYCNVTGQGGIDSFDRCLNTTNIRAGTAVKGQCFKGDRAAADAMSEAPKVSWRSSKKKKQTVSAALLIALGVAGIVLGS